MSYFMRIEKKVINSLFVGAIALGACNSERRSVSPVLTSIPEPTPTQPVPFVASEFTSREDYIEETTGLDLDLVPLLPNPLKTQDGLTLWISQSKLNTQEGETALPLLVVEKDGIYLDAVGIARVEEQIPILTNMDQKEKAIVEEVNSYLDRTGDIVDVYLGVKVKDGVLQFVGPALSSNLQTNVLRIYNSESSEWEELLGGNSQITSFKEILSVQGSPIPLPIRTPVPAITPVPTETLTPEQQEEKLFLESLSPWDIRRMKWTQANLDPQWENGIPGIYCPVSNLSSDLAESCKGSSAKTEIKLQIMIDADLYNRNTLPIRGLDVNPDYQGEKDAQDFANGVAFIVNLLKSGSGGFKQVPVNMDLQEERRSDGNWWVPLQFYPVQMGPNFRYFDPKQPIMIVLKDRGYYPEGNRSTHYGIGVTQDTHSLVIFLNLDLYNTERVVGAIFFGIERHALTPLLKIADLHVRQLRPGGAEVGFTPEAEVQVKKFSTIVWGRSYLREDTVDLGLPPPTGLLLPAIIEDNN